MTTSATNSASNIISSSGILHLPYNLVTGVFGFAAGTINYVAGPAVGVGGIAVRWIFNENNYYAGSAVTAAVAFGFIAKEGWEMVKTPYSAKASWCSIENRFKGKYELKGKLVNLSELIGKITPDTVVDITGNTVYRTDIAYDEAQAQFDNAEAAAVIAERSVNQLQGLSDWAELHATRVQATQAKQDLDEAKTEAERLRGVATASKTKLDEAKKKKDDAKKLADEAVKAVPKKDPKKDDKKVDESIPDGNHLISYTVEKSKPKPGETYIPIPMSDNAILINHENMKKDFLRSASGMPILTSGILGVIGSVSETEKALFGTEAIQTLSQIILGQTLTNAAWAIRKPVQVVTGMAGKTVSWVASYDSMGLSKLTAAALMGYSGYKILSGGLKVPFHGYEITKPIDGVWFNFKKTNPADPTVKKDVIVTDIVKIATGTTLIAASILSVDDFFSGNYYA